MAFQAVPNTAVVCVNGTLWGQEIQNTLYFEKDTGYILADLLDLAALVRSWWFAEVMPLLSSDYIFREITAQDISVEAGEIAFNTAETGTAGGVVSEAMPGNVAIAVSFRTGLAGRSYRGRNYVGGLPNTAVAGNTITDTFRTAIGAAYEALLTVLEDEDFVWGVVSRVTEGLPRPVGVITAIASVLVVDAFVDSQRRRLSGRGV